MTKVKLIPEYAVFTVQVDGVDIGQFRQVGEWEGFRKLACGRETLIVVSDGSFSDRFGDTFAKIFGNELAPEFLVVKATPDTQVALNAAKTKKAPDGKVHS